MRLNVAPTENVTVIPTSTDTSAAMVSPAMLTFTTSNWNTAQTITVMGVDDTADNPDNQRTTTITHAVSGGNYDNATINDRVTTTP